MHRRVAEINMHQVRAPAFQFDLRLTPALDDLRIGTRAIVRFRHDPEPLAAQALRRLRQLFLSQLHV